MAWLLLRLDAHARYVTFLWINWLSSGAALHSRGSQDTRSLRGNCSSIPGMQPLLRKTSSNVFGISNSKYALMFLSNRTLAAPLPQSRR